MYTFNCFQANFYTELKISAVIVILMLMLIVKVIVIIIIVDEEEKKWTSCWLANGASGKRFR